MRKNTLLTCMFALVLVVGLAMLAGCGGNGEGGSGKAGQVKADSTVVVIGEEQFKLSSSAEMGAMHYLENYVDFHTDQIGIIRTMSYGVGDTFHFEIRMITVEGQSLDEAKAAVETTSGTTEQTREINGVSYVYYGLLLASASTYGRISSATREISLASQPLSTVSVMNRL